MLLPTASADCMPAAAQHQGFSPPKQMFPYSSTEDNASMVEASHCDTFQRH